MKRLGLEATETFIVWNENLYDGAPSFVSVLQVYTDKVATILKANVTVTYSVSVILLNFNLNFRRYLIDHGQTMVTFLTASTTTEDENDYVNDRVRRQQSASPSEAPLKKLLQVTMERDEKISKLEGPHDATRKTLKPLIDNVKF